MTDSNISGYLSKLPFFLQDPAQTEDKYNKELGILLSFCQYEGFRDGQPIFFEGEEGDKLYIQLDGSCAVTNDELQNAAEQARELAEQIQANSPQQSKRKKTISGVSSSSSVRTMSVNVARAEKGLVSNKKNSAVAPIGGHDEGGGEITAEKSNSPSTSSSNSPQTPPGRRSSELSPGAPTANVNYRRNSMSKENSVTNAGSNKKLVAASDNPNNRERAKSNVLGTFQKMLTGKEVRENWD